MSDSIKPKAFMTIFFLLVGFALYLGYINFLENAQQRPDIRKTLIQSRKNVQNEFDGLRMETLGIIKDLEKTKKTFLNNSIINYNGLKTTAAEVLSDSIDVTVCKVYARKIAILDKKILDIKDAASIFFYSLDSLVLRLKDSPKLYVEMKMEADTILLDYKIALKRANSSIRKAENKFETICNYRDVIIIMSNIIAIREKINELNKITDEAILIIKELNEFAINGKDIINKSI